MKQQQQHQKQKQKENQKVRKMLKQVVQIEIQMNSPNEHNGKSVRKLHSFF